MGKYSYKLLDQTNVIGGGLVAFLIAIFGEMWFLFAGLLILNLLDWFSGWIWAVKNHESSSKIGARGIAKKVGYWVIIGVSFYIGFSFEQMGEILEIPLEFMNGIGWFVLANYLVNEIRSLLENAVKLHVPVPTFLTHGLKITGDLIDCAVDVKLQEKRGKINEHKDCN